MCTYKTYKWNTQLKKAVKRKKIKHRYSELNRYEIDKITGCTVCSEDQIKIKLPGVLPFSICKLLANDVEQTLLKLINTEKFINHITGYRVGMTRGKPDKLFNRTKFSNHSYGIALDINANQNGLYDHCIHFSDKCQLIRGGTWNPNKKGSLTLNNSIVIQMKQLGFRWGGEIAGKQKDFMHFSPSGY